MFGDWENVETGVVYSVIQTSRHKEDPSVRKDVNQTLARWCHESKT